ncbi:MAG: thioredoxin domain-containing protein [Gammaproteobacteria bacterium]|nr:thioredoxin domain-containing protein [Gammaproteobacteria bacterium]
MANELARETSPYLLQHADNPVDWLPWSRAALEKARAENKPILLSIGYSACHWCHVMAHESFEDPETAELMNRLYVNIKVDREERPDIDKIYQTAHQLYTGRAGGWPLTVFLTPDTHVPIVVGTYFPKEPRYGMPSFKDVLIQVEAYYRNHGSEIAARGSALLETFARIESGETANRAAPNAAPLAAAREHLLASFDREHGGFGGAPKFPRAAALELLLEQSRRVAGEQGRELAHVVVHTLKRMAERGLYDHLGGGFFRYSVDRRWSIPHFEKMLYDNAALLALYAEAAAATGDASFARTAVETAEFLLREMRDSAGGFYSTLDADADGREGGYYVFTPEELDAVLTPAEAAVAKRVFGLDRDPNFVDPHDGVAAWHLEIVRPVAEIDDGRAPSLLESARRKLLEAREKRVRPGRDEKILAGWNGLAIRALATAGRRLDRADLVDAATEAADFVRERLWRGGRLLATYKDGRARFAAYLDDYAFVADGLLALLECRWRADDLSFAIELAETALEHFEDETHGGFFFTADDHEQLIHRPKSYADEAVPSGNGVLCKVLLTLGHVLGETRYIDAVERTLTAAMPLLAEFPDAHATMLLALDRFLGPQEVVIVRAKDAEIDAARRLLARDYRPHRASFVIPNGVSDLPGLLAERKGGDDTIGYVCRGTSCLAPTVGLDALRAAL